MNNEYIPSDAEVMAEFAHLSDAALEAALQRQEKHALTSKQQGQPYACTRLADRRAGYMQWCLEQRRKQIAD